MSPVWLENVLAHQPARWLPQGYANYDELLTAAVEAAVDDAENAALPGLYGSGDECIAWISSIPSGATFRS